MAEGSLLGRRPGEPVWVKLPPGEPEPYGEAKVVSVTGDNFTVDLGGSQMVVHTADMLHANPDKVQPDLTNLMVLNEATMLDNLRKRYNAGNIYTRASSLLVCLNPYRPLPELYNEAVRKKAKSSDLYDPFLEPHLYHAAEKAYRDLLGQRKSQSLVISGESGAGKTESMKICMNYLVWRAETGHGQANASRKTSAGETNEELTMRIMQSNPVLEAVGNAKTRRNNNSSRFGKYINLLFDADTNIVGAEMRTFLLEKSRVTNADASNERSYHMLYQMMASPPLEGKKPGDFRMLSLSGTTTIPGVNDAEDFKKLQLALGWFNIANDLQRAMWDTLAAVLHLGNVLLDDHPEDKEKSVINATHAHDLAVVEQLLGVSNLQENILEKVILSPRSKTEMRMDLAATGAASARDALIKQLYARVFEFLVFAINQSLGSNRDRAHVIGILDVFGFEMFDSNSFEQVCINYANERLHNFFMQQVFMNEIELYKREGIELPAISPPDNTVLCKIFDEQRTGAFTLLDTISRSPGPTDGKFAAELHSAHGSNPYFGVGENGKVHDLMKKSKLMRIEEGFVVHHFAGSVVYNVAGFLEKNDNKTNEQFDAKLRASKQIFLQEIFKAEAYALSPAAAQPGGTAAKAAPAASGGPGFSSVSKTFVLDLKTLMGELSATEPHFIRCLKPNEFQEARRFEGTGILNQMRSNGLLEAVKLMQASYPSRATYTELLNVFGRELPKTIVETFELHKQVEMLLLATSAEPTDYILGKNLVFFKRDAGRVLDELRATPPSQIKHRMVDRLAAKGKLSADEQALVDELNALIKKEEAEKARIIVTSIVWAVCSVVAMRRRARGTLQKRKQAAVKLQAQRRGAVSRHETKQMAAKREAERRIEEEKRRKEKELADAEAAERAKKAAQLKREAEEAERAAAEAKKLADAAAAAAGAASQQQQQSLAEATQAANQAAKQAQTSRMLAEQAVTEAAVAETAAAAIEVQPIQENPGMTVVAGIRCYKEIVCAGGTGVFQRHNFDGIWRVGDDLCDELPRYEHRTPNGQMVHLFHVKSAYGGAPRWVIGPIPGNENGWGFVDTDATRPENIMDRWMVWMETAWEESKKLYFRGKEDADEEDDIDDDDDDDDDDELTPKGKAKAKRRSFSGSPTKAKKNKNADGAKKTKKNANKAAAGGQGSAKGAPKKDAGAVKKKKK